MMACYANMRLIVSLLLLMFLAAPFDQAQGRGPAALAHRSFSEGGQTGQYFPPAGAWAKKTPAELGLDPAKLAESVTYAQSRESTRAIDFSDQERTFGSLLGSLPTKRARTNGLVIYKGYQARDRRDQIADLPPLGGRLP